jgi:uncharacterized protein (DUF488 family)
LLRAAYIIRPGDAVRQQIIKMYAPAQTGDFAANDQDLPAMPVIFTIGHSTRPLKEFFAALKAQAIELVADVRTIPRSRHNPQYNGDALAKALREQGIFYEHMKDLGGLRHAKKGSVNTAWENASFRGFADYMQTVDFEKGVKDLIDVALKKRTVILCAEALPWRCHRSLIGDALLARGITVMDIMGISSVNVHALTPWARVTGTRVTYPKA